MQQKYNFSMTTSGIDFTVFEKLYPRRTVKFPNSKNIVSLGNCFSHRSITLSHLLVGVIDLFRKEAIDKCISPSYRQTRIEISSFPSSTSFSFSNRTHLISHFTFYISCSDRRVQPRGIKFPIPCYKDREIKLPGIIQYSRNIQHN